MKKQIFIVIALVVACLFSMSCGKAGGTGAGNIVGTWVIAKEETTMSDGTVKTVTDKSDWSKDSPNYVSFSYMLTFSSDGVLSGKSVLEIDLVPSSYEIKNGYIYNLGVQFAKIVSNNGKTLVLELADGMLRMQNSAREYLDEPLIVKCVATYNKQ